MARLTVALEVPSLPAAAEKLRVSATATKIESSSSGSVSSMKHYVAD